MGLDPQDGLNIGYDEPPLLDRDGNWGGPLGGSLRERMMEAADMIGLYDEESVQRPRRAPGVSKLGQRRRTLQQEAVKHAAEIERREEKLRRINQRLEALEQIPLQDPFNNGDVLVFRAFMGGSVYTFAALNVRGSWYTTGTVGPQGVAWAEFADWLVMCGCTRVRRATSYTEVSLQAPRTPVEPAEPVGQAEQPPVTEPGAW